VNKMRLWDFVSASGRNEIRVWFESLSQGDQGRVEQKLVLLSRVEFSLLIHTNCLAGPIDKTGSIYKLRVRGDRNIRLLLCKGPDPMTMDVEYTLLLGAAEPNRTLVPRGAPETALRYRFEVLEDLARPRCPHESVERAVKSSV
jgi:hypothetical protein